MIKRIVKYFFLVFTIGFNFCFLIIANANASLPTRFSADGYVSTDYLVGQADVMLPLEGNADHNFYIDPALAYGSESQGFADLGLGYRWVKNNAVILGGYLFGGYSRIDNNARLWVVNPGIEALGSRWDAHLNGYFVMGDRNKTFANFLTFDEFNGHSELFYLFDVNQHVGDGVDAKLGYFFPGTPLKAYVGSYFFSPAQTNNVLGGAVGLEYWTSQHIKVFVNYTYDNLRHSVGALGIGVELGGTHVNRIDPNVEERITDPVERYLAELGRGSAIPSQQKTQFAGVVDPSIPDGNDNFAFFSLTGGPNNGGMGLTLNNCTFENPCGPTDLTNQGTQTLANLLPNTRIFFLGGTGTYSALDVLGGTNPVTIQTGQSINAFTPSQPPTFNGGFILPGNNSLNNIILLPTTSTVTGAGVSALGNNVNINASQIGSTTNAFATGLALTGDTLANLVSSRIFASSSGINISDSASLTTEASMITVNGGTNAVGINSSSSALLNLTQGSIVNVTGGDATFGVNSNGGGDFVLSDASSINVNGVNNSIGLLTAGVGTVTVNEKSSINLNASGPNAIGYVDLGSSPVNISEASSINVNSSAAMALGYFHQGSSNISFSEGSSINVNAAGQNQIVGFADAPTATGDITFNASDINVTGEVNTLALGSSGAGNLNIINGSTFKITGNDDSNGIDISGNRAINFLDSSLIFVGGNDSTGFISTGNGDIVIERSRFTLTEGATSSGFEFSGDGNITIEESIHTFVGGDDFVGVSSLGNGDTVIRNNTFDLTTGDTSKGFIFGGNQIVRIENGIHNFTGGNNFIGVKTLGNASVHTIRGLFNVTGGDNAYIYEIGGIGPITIAEGSSLTLNAPSGNSVGGIHLLPISLSPLTISESEFIVIGGNTARGIFAEGLGNVSVTGSNFRVNAIDALGLDVLGTGVVDLVEGNLIDVNGTGNLYGIRAADGLSITGRDFNLIVAAEDTVSTAIGLATLNTGIINLHDIDMDITGGPGSMITQPLGGLITLTGINVCILNGNPVAC